MASGERTVWIGRGIRARPTVGGHQPATSPRTLRIVTDGRPPAPDDLAEVISDPFFTEDGDPFSAAMGADPISGEVPAALAEWALGPPVRPSKIVCVGRNFRAHAAEMGSELPTEPLLFFKPPSCLVGSGATVELPRGFERIDMESELVVVVGRRGRAISRKTAYQHVLGYTLGNDVSCRDLQRRDQQWTRAKGCDGFGPVGPFVRLVPPGTEPPLAALRLMGRRNQELRQDTSLGAMIFDPAAILECASAVMTLEPGDLFFMGTPEGVTPIEPGHSVTVELGGAWPLAPLTTSFT